MSIELDGRAPAHQLEDAIKKVESSSARREWPVYREITRQERADRASAEFLQSERRREFQRQNDKFIGREPKVGRTWMVSLKYFKTNPASKLPWEFSELGKYAFCMMK